MPPAWSSLPDTGLNFTSTKPSLILSSIFAAQQNVASPDCLRTFAREGAVSSLTTSHLATPLPVMPVFQPFGKLAASSKVTLVSDIAKLDATTNTAMADIHLFN